ncbi:MAG: hypothetical protein R3Y58_01855 [Eubacteriales bacterium]
MSKLQDIRSGYTSIGILGDEERFVRFDLNAFAEMERIYGNMDAANQALTKGSMVDVRRMLWLGLIHDQAILDEITGEPIKYKLTVYEVGKWLTPQNMQGIMTKLNGAISSATPESSNSTAAQEHAKAIDMKEPTTDSAGKPVVPFPNRPN